MTLFKFRIGSCSNCPHFELLKTTSFIPRKDKAFIAASSLFLISGRIRLSSSFENLQDEPSPIKSILKLVFLENFEIMPPHPSISSSGWAAIIKTFLSEKTYLVDFLL